MQIHELEVFVGNLDENTYFAVDDGTETAKLTADNILPVAMTVAEAALGTETATRVIAPSVFKEAVDTLANDAISDKAVLKTDIIDITHGGTGATTAANARTALNAEGSISIVTKEISYTVDANGYAGGDVIVTKANYAGRCVVGWNVAGTGSSNTIPIKCFYTQAENRLYWGIKNVGSSQVSGVLKVFVLFTAI